MQTLKELTNESFDAIHNILYNHLIETKGECDHDEHGQLLVDVIDSLNVKVLLKN
jgi:hypothetical protein